MKLTSVNISPYSNKNYVLFSHFIDLETTEKSNFWQKLSEGLTAFPESKKLSAPMMQTMQVMQAMQVMLVGDGIQVMKV